MGVRVQESLQICLVSRSKSKNRDNLSRFGGKQLTHIVRVGGYFYLNVKIYGKLIG